MEKGSDSAQGFMCQCPGSRLNAALIASSPPASRARFPNYSGSWGHHGWGAPGVRPLPGSEPRGDDTGGGDLFEV
jgi:hypothetical protein